ncbi:MAG: PAC2 family protein [Chloroflexota bacterium]|nr:MAG: PAC2 family protein [Chloroflexota bacterium]
MEHVHFTERPVLRDPILIAAFAGWNDAAGAATFAVRYLLRQWSARRFGSIDPEDFYLFTETRPTVQLIDGQERELEWPSNELYYHRDALSGRDFIALVGVEPNLKWRTYCGIIQDLVREHKVTAAVTVGSMLNDVPHTTPARVVGYSTDPALSEKLRRLNVQAASYEGPTGIVSVVNNTLRAEGVSVSSLWGNVPRYLPAIPSPKVSAALLRRLTALLEIIIDLTEIEALAITYDTNIAEAVARNPDVAAYVRRLEDRERELATEDQDRHSRSLGPLSTNALMRELEEFLKRQRQGDQP